MAAFILRFQEKVQQVSEVSYRNIQVGKNTAGGACESTSRIFAGTKTTTRVKSESADTDAQKTGTALQRQKEILLGTQTQTAVKAESPDKDPKTAIGSYIPRCFSY